MIINNVLDSRFAAFNNRLEKEGMYTKKGSMVDASFLTAPRQRNSREENEQLKEGDLPEYWSLNKMRHKDTDAD
ncbi:Mobile element protein [Arcticibacter svalbardensis MN12-7]|uniref:Mobile element protein n=1 Tax=Arcticibacter svalbardensis MN12-7 TaxID=1150600 RepID=R9GLL9_9SPHI|nr:hypothetical protein [Arcticibacter svalbardensis]EOR92591.1 Mobile element protein [Arcticibacter svalbardensis MN12-7]